MHYIGKAAYYYTTTRHSRIVDIRRVSGVDCDTDHYLVVANVKKIMAAHKQSEHKFDGKGFNLRNLNELEVRKKYQIEIKKMFAALKNLRDDLLTYSMEQSPS
jgi:hypothetical protein